MLKYYCYLLFLALILWFESMGIEINSETPQWNVLIIIIVSDGTLLFRHCPTIATESTLDSFNNCFSIDFYGMKAP